MEVIDLTLSDTDEPTASDTASLAHLTDLLPTSAIDSVVETGPAVFAPKKEDDSTGPEVLEGAGFQGKRSRGSGRSGSPTKQPKKRTKNSARKSTHRVTDGKSASHRISGSRADHLQLKERPGKPSMLPSSLQPNKVRLFRQTSSGSSISDDGRSRRAP